MQVKMYGIIYEKFSYGFFEYTYMVNWIYIYVYCGSLWFCWVILGKLHYVAVTGERSEAQRAGSLSPGSIWIVTHSVLSFPQYYFDSRTLAVLVFRKAENMNHIMECRADSTFFLFVCLSFKNSDLNSDIFEILLWEFTNPSCYYAQRTFPSREHCIYFNQMTLVCAKYYILVTFAVFGLL